MRDWSGTLGSEEKSGFVVLSGMGRAGDRFFFWTWWSVSMTDGAVADGVWSVSLATHLTGDPHAPPAHTPRTSTLSVSAVL